MKALLLLLALAPAARAELREISSMKEIVPAVTPDTLLVFDLDNTLVEPLGNAGSDQWYYYVVDALKRDGLSDDAADKQATAAWKRALRELPVKPVEALTPALIAAQQKRGARTMGLTAREPSDAGATFAQFKSAGYDLSAATVGPGAMDLKPEELASDQPGRFERGVLFVGDGPDKGKALAGFLKKLGLKPAKVVFVDDKLKHARNVDRALGEAGIPCVSFRYGATDAKVKAFNDVMAEAATPAQADFLFHGRLPAPTTRGN